MDCAIKENVAISLHDCRTNKITMDDDMLDVVNGGINPVEIIKYLLKFVIGKIQD